MTAGRDQTGTEPVAGAGREIPGAAARPDQVARETGAERRTRIRTSIAGAREKLARADGVTFRPADRFFALMALDQLELIAAIDERLEALEGRPCGQDRNMSRAERIALR